MKPVERRARDLRYTIASLSGFIDGTGGNHDWDDYTSCSSGDHDLDAIRREAAQIDLPVDSEGSAKLKELLARAETLAPSPGS